MSYYIYLTTNKINGKQYLGQHKGEINNSYLGSGIYLSKAIKKYGKENFSKQILKICQTRDEADYWEKFYIEQYNAVENTNFYNLQEGGTGGDGWQACHKWLDQHPEEASKIYQENWKRLQKWHEDNPKKRQELVIKPMLEASHKYWKEHPEELEKHMKEVNEAKIKWQQNNPEKHQQQVEAWRKAGSDANSQKIICITTGEIFESQSAAARYYGLAQSNISRCLKGERQSAGKHPITKQKLVWKLCEKEE